MHNCLRAYRDEDARTIKPREMDLKIMGMDTAEKISANAARSETITAHKDERILAITGLVPVHKGMAEIWSITGEPVDTYKILFAKLSIIVIDAWIRKYNLIRLQANVHVEHTQSMNWLEWLGFEREGLMRKFGLNGEDFYLYARTT